MRTARALLASAFTLIASAAALAPGCSVINKLDEVVPSPPGPGGSGPSSTSSGAAGGAGGSGAAAGAGGAGGGASRQGIVMVGAQDPMGGAHLTAALDPWNGATMDSWPWAAVSIAYGSADHWLVLDKTSPASLPAPGQVGNRRIVRYNPEQDDFTVVAELPATVFMPQNRYSTAGLRGFFGYLSWDVVSGMTVIYSLHVVRNNGVDVSSASFTVNTSAERYVSLVGYPAGAADGGSLVITTVVPGANMGECQARFYRGVVGSDGTLGASAFNMAYPLMDGANPAVFACDIAPPGNVLPSVIIDPVHAFRLFIVVPQREPASLGPARAFRVNFTGNVGFALENRTDIVPAVNAPVGAAYDRCDDILMFVNRAPMNQLIAFPFATPTAFAARLLNHTGDQAVWDQENLYVFEVFGSGNTGRVTPYERDTSTMPPGLAPVTPWDAPDLQGLVPMAAASRQSPPLDLSLCN